MHIFHRRPSESLNKSNKKCQSLCLCAGNVLNEKKKKKKKKKISAYNVLNVIYIWNERKKKNKKKLYLETLSVKC